MSAPAESSAEKASKPEDKSAEATKEPEKPAAALEEDDEFEDFPVEDWTEEEAQVPGGNAHLWEESWDDDDISEDFSAQLKEELKKMEANKRS